MIYEKLIDLLPEEISDESVYYLVNFFMELSTALESHYYPQMKRFMDEYKEMRYRDSMDKSIDSIDDIDDPPF